MNYQSPWRPAFKLLFGLFLIAGPLARGATIVVDVPNVSGTLTYGDPAINFPFDVGAKFASIDSLVVRIQGTGEEGLMRVYTQFTPVENVFHPPLSVTLPGAEGASASTGAAGPVWLSDTELTYEADFQFNIALLPATIEHLLDGEGELTLQSANAFATIGGSPFEILDPSVLHLTGAQIIIGGTLAVPSPATSPLLLGAIGVMLTSAYARRWYRKAFVIA